MKMNPAKLNAVQIDEIRRLAADKRLSLGFPGETPVANDIFSILDRLNIKLLEYPVKSEGNRPAFSAAIIHADEDARELTFIGLNTADYYDKQLFAIVHELYHYYTKTGTHLSRSDDEESSIIEAKANRFAAEFLMPESVLKSIVMEDFRTSSLENVNDKSLTRFIARLHCYWWLPFRSLVKRLHEIGAIDSRQYANLYLLNERDLNGEFGILGQAINKEIFVKLNSPTYNIGTAPNEIEVIIRNYEDNLIDEDKFASTLALFNRAPAEFGYTISVSDQDLDELDDFFSMEDGDEG